VDSTTDRPDCDQPVLGLSSCSAIGHSGPLLLPGPIHPRVLQQARYALPLFPKRRGQDFILPYPPLAHKEIGTSNELYNFCDPWRNEAWRCQRCRNSKPCMKRDSILRLKCDCAWELISPRPLCHPNYVVPDLAPETAHDSRAISIYHLISLGPVVSNSRPSARASRSRGPSHLGDIASSTSRFWTPKPITAGYSERKVGARGACCVAILFPLSHSYILTFESWAAIVPGSYWTPTGSSSRDCSVVIS